MFLILKKSFQPIAIALLFSMTTACAETGLLRITTNASDARIFINGQRAGISTGLESQPLTVKLPQGNYTVEATKSDSTSYYGKKSVFVANDSEQTVVIFLAKAVNPLLDYGNQSNGSVVIGGLEWLRCSAGQEWVDSSCSGEPLEYTFEQTQEIANKLNTAGYGGKSDWRVPSIRELHSLVNCSKGYDSVNRDIQDGGKLIPARCNDRSTAPTINLAEFPKSVGTSYWSSTPATNDSEKVWYLSFANGRVNDSASRDNGYGRLRLVRSADSK